MKIRKLFAGLVIAGSLTAGFAGIAAAQTPSTDSTAPTTHVFSCDTAKDHLAQLQHRIDWVKDHIAQAEARIDQLRQQGHDDRADALAKRVETVKDRLTKVEARFDKLTQRVAERCGADPNTSSSSSSGL